MATGRDKLKELNRKRNPRTSGERFITFKMWLNFFVSLVAKDRGTIPENIGNNILILNNMYITKNFLSSVINIVEMSLDTPITFLGEMVVNELRVNNCPALVDFTIKGRKKQYNLGDSGLKSRIAMWEVSETNQYLKEKDKIRATRLLYAVDQIREGHSFQETRMYLTLRAKTGADLAITERIVYKYLSKIGCVFRPISTDVAVHLQYMSLLSSLTSKDTKSIPSVINSDKTLSQLLPNSHAPGSRTGIYMGINTITGTPYRFDFKSVTMARNIYVVTGSGSGKTALVLNMLASALEEGFYGCIMDIKGNEFGTIVDAVGGATISLRETSEEYINTFRMIKEECGSEPERYFKERVNFSKRQMIILSGVHDPSLTMILEGFLDEFLDYVYTAVGVRPDNPNTWFYTDKLNPYVIYDYLTGYLNQPIKEKYKDVMVYINTNLKMYFSRSGSKSYIFTRELQYKDLLTRKAIRFDFGILAGTLYDETIFRLKFEYMSRINGEYVTANYDAGIHTFKVLEESQAVSDEVISAYAREYTLRRSQLQTTMLLGNSVDALLRNRHAMPIVETTTGLLVGKLSKTTADLVIKHFDVDHRASLIRDMAADNAYLRHFLFINNMEPKALCPIIKVMYDPAVKYKLLTPTKVKEG